MSRLLPASLKVTVPLILLGFAVVLSALNVVYQVPLAERAVEEDHRERLLQELSRLQSTLEYLLHKGDIEGARREVAILASNRNYTVVALTDDQHRVIAATQRAWLGRPAVEVLPKFDSGAGSTGHTRAWRAGRARVRQERAARLRRTSRWGSASANCAARASGQLFFEYDLKRAKDAASGQIVAQSLYWTGWVTALAVVLCGSSSISC